MDLTSISAMTIGVDCGLSGAVVALDINGRLFSWNDCPVLDITKTKRDFLPAKMYC